MGFKGFNSILFDFYSLVDIELSLINFIKGEYRDMELPNLDKHRILYTDDNSWIFERQFGKEDIFKSLIIGDEYKSKYKDIFDSIIKENEEEIITNYAYPTAIDVLISAYKKAGDGVIHTAVQCENEFQKRYIESRYPGIKIEFASREDVDMSNYGRLIVGDYRNALKYNLEEPKSILILNYRENFNEKDSTQLKPELIIKFGDIHDISVISAYRDISQE